MNDLTEQGAVNGGAPRWLVWWVRALVFLFPVSVATVGWGSAIFFLLLFPALYYGRGWSTLHVWERRLLLGYVAVFAVMSLSMVNAEEYREGVKGLDRYLRFVLMIPIYLMFRRFDFRLGREFAVGALLACVLMMAQAIYQVEWQGKMFATGYYHKIVFGDLAVWWAGVAALFALTLTKNGLARLGIVALIGMALYASLLSQTRGAWLFVPLIPAVLLWAYWRRLQLTRSTLIGAVVVIFALATIMAMQSDRLRGGIERGVSELQAFEANPAAPTSWGVRLNLWRNALLIFKESPLLGTGVGDFQSDMKRMVEDGRSLNPYVSKFGHAHSIYFDTLAKGGLLGFVATVGGLLLIPFIVFVMGVRRAERPEEQFYAIGGVLLIAAFATFGVSEGLWTRNPFVNTYVISLVVFLAGMAKFSKYGKHEQ